MKIIIHRGIDQIGGCITEIATDKTRIFIDFGQNLPNGDGIVYDDFANQEAVKEITNDIDAIFYTHYHGDHIGLFQYVPNRITQYIGAAAKQIAICKHRQLSYIKGREKLSAKEISILENMKVFVPEQIICIGDIKVTPYFVSHSAYDSYMFLIESNGKRILHTGDFRGHGYLSKGMLPAIEKYILKYGKIDFLITEGTMLSRLEEKVMTEYALQREARSIAVERSSN